MRNTGGTHNLRLPGPQIPLRRGVRHRFAFRGVPNNFPLSPTDIKKSRCSEKDYQKQKFEIPCQHPRVSFENNLEATTNFNTLRQVWSPGFSPRGVQFVQTLGKIQSARHVSPAKAGTPNPASIANRALRALQIAN